MVTRVVKKNEEIEDFDRNKIKRAIRMAHLEAVGTVPRPEKDAKFDTIIGHIEDDFSKRGVVTVDEIHDKVEKTLMYEEEFDTAKAYILYRDKKNSSTINEPTVILGEQEYTYGDLLEAVENISGVSYSEENLEEVINTLPRQATFNDFLSAIIYDMKTQFEFEPKYQYHAAQVLLEQVYQEVEAQGLTNLEDVLRLGVEQDIYDQRILDVFGEEGLTTLDAAIDTKRDDLFKFMGIQTLVDRYLTKSREGNIIETPQVFWMRVAMGLSLLEDRPVERAIEFYDVLSNFYGSSSTPTLFNSGTKNNQLASCFVPTVQDTIESIFDGYKEAAILAKFSGGLGVDFGGIRAMNSKIHGLGGAPSSGVIPFLKIMNDTMAGLMQGGKRRSNAAVYIEPWHPDIEDFLDLRNNTGDERRRTHDLNTAIWIPDLFMERVHRDEDWWLISPSDAPELHESYGEEFKKNYETREKQAETGVFTTARKVRATNLWRNMLMSAFETGNFWMTWKDASNIRSPQDHVGIVHSSNLCTEITLNSSEEETPVCNLASINLHRMTETGEINRPLLSATVKTLVRMLDNVIDLNFYPVEKAKTANLRHRPVGLGVMGFQDALWNLGTHASDPERTPLVAEVLMQRIAYDAHFASSDLARERGAYESFKGSKWDRGILPHDTIDMLFATRSVDVQDKKVYPELSEGWEMNYDLLRENISKYGMRNSNVLAIAPTATISNIQGVTQSIEPPFSNLFVKSNLSGKFTIVNDYLVEDLKKLGLWDKDMLDMLKYYDGSVQSLPIPEYLKEKYRTAYEIPYEVLIESAARRQMWIDQAQSLNLYIEGTDGKKLSDMYMLAWKSGLKTTYYLRSRAATSVDKVSIDTNKFSLRQAGSKQTSAASKIDVNTLRNTILDNPRGDMVQSNIETNDDLYEDDWEEFICESCQ